MRLARKAPSPSLKVAKHADGKRKPQRITRYGATRTPTVDCPAEAASYSASVEISLLV